MYFCRINKYISNQLNALPSCFDFEKMLDAFVFLDRITILLIMYVWKPVKQSSITTLISCNVQFEIKFNDLLASFKNLEGLPYQFYAWVITDVYMN